MIAEYDWWEYADFVYAIWPPQSTWRRIDLGAEDMQAVEAQHYFWRKSQAEIESALKPWRDCGWDPVGPVGPQAIKLAKSLQKRSGFDPVRLLFWILTLGVALVIDWLFTSPITYVTFEPVEFRIRLRRIKKTEWVFRAAAQAAVSADQNSPTIFPSASMSMFSAAGCSDKPGMVCIVPHNG